MISKTILMDYIKTIEPPILEEYLIINGWTKQADIDNNKGSIWIINQNGREFSVFLPIITKAPDFGICLYELLKTLEYVELRSCSEIVSSLINAKTIAKIEKREILFLKFQYIYQEELSQEMPIQYIGNILTNLQTLFDNIGEVKITDNFQTIKQKTQLSLFGTFKGSFGINLALKKSNKQLDMFNKSWSGEIISEVFFKLIHFSNYNDKQILKQELINLQKKCAASYRKFLINLIKSQADFYVNWGSINPDKGGRTNLNYSNAIQTVEFINKMEIEDPDDD